MKKIFNVLLIVLMVLFLVSCDPELGQNNNNNNNNNGGNNNNNNNTTETLRDKNPKYDIYYQLFVRSFADSDGDGIGDLKGVEQNLDYLEDLGITAIWMLPIHETDTDWASYHGYRVKDYYSINPEYGTMKDFEDLIKAANKKGIKIVMDLVINHTSDRHPWYYSDTLGDGKGSHPEYYFSGTPVFPGGYKDLDLYKEEVYDVVVDIVNFYIDKGVEGFRIDAAQHLFDFDTSIKNNYVQKANAVSSFLGKVRNEARKNNPNVFFVGEAFDYNYSNYTRYYLGLDSLFEFYVAAQIWDLLGNEKPNGLINRINNAYSSHKGFNPDFIPSNFLSNHDIDRMAGWGQFNDANGLMKQKLAASMLLTLPGNPHIYYGEEIGMKGSDYSGDTTSQGVIYDHYRRSPFLWGDTNKETTWLDPYKGSHSTPTVATLKNDSNSLLNHYKTMANLRKDNPALMYGNSFDVWSGNTTTLQGIVREYNDGDVSQKLVIIYNMSNNVQSVDIDHLNIIYGTLSIPKFGVLVLEIE